jgi:hypothetical protein
MPQPCLEVHCPTPGEKKQLIVYSTGGKKYGFLAAYGWSCDISNLMGCLINHKTLQVYPGSVIKKLPNWVIGFSGLPLEEAEYDLIVVQITPQAIDQAAIVEFKAGEKGGIVVKDVLPTTTPAANSTVCPGFYANGSDGPNGPPTSATMTPAGGGATQGASINTGIPGVWMYQFTGLANSPPAYTFSVTNGTDTTTNGNITVNSMACPPPGQQP